MKSFLNINTTEDINNDNEEFLVKMLSNNIALSIKKKEKKLKVQKSGSVFSTPSFLKSIQTIFHYFAKIKFDFDLIKTPILENLKNTYNIAIDEKELKLILKDFEKNVIVKASGDINGFYNFSSLIINQTKISELKKEDLLTYSDKLNSKHEESLRFEESLHFEGKRLDINEVAASHIEYGITWIFTCIAGGRGTDYKFVDSCMYISYCGKKLTSIRTIVKDGVQLAGRGRKNKDIDYPMLFFVINSFQIPDSNEASSGLKNDVDVDTILYDICKDDDNFPKNVLENNEAKLMDKYKKQIKNHNQNVKKANMTEEEKEEAKRKQRVYYERRKAEKIARTTTTSPTPTTTSTITAITSSTKKTTTTTTTTTSLSPDNQDELTESSSEGETPEDENYEYENSESENSEDENSEDSKSEQDVRKRKRRSKRTKRTEVEDVNLKRKQKSKRTKRTEDEDVNLKRKRTKLTKTTKRTEDKNPENSENSDENSESENSESENSEYENSEVSKSEQDVRKRKRRSKRTKRTEDEDVNLKRKRTKRTEDKNSENSENSDENSEDENSEEENSKDENSKDESYEDENYEDDTAEDSEVKSSGNENPEDENYEYENSESENFEYENSEDSKSEQDVRKRKKRSKRAKRTEDEDVNLKKKRRKLTKRTEDKNSENAENSDENSEDENSESENPEYENSEDSKSEQDVRKRKGRSKRTKRTEDEDENLKRKRTKRTEDKNSENSDENSEDENSKEENSEDEISKDENYEDDIDHINEKNKFLTNEIMKKQEELIQTQLKTNTTIHFKTLQKELDKIKTGQILNNYSLKNPMAKNVRNYLANPSQSNILKAHHAHKAVTASKKEKKKKMYTPEQKQGKLKKLNESYIEAFGETYSKETQENLHLVSSHLVAKESNVNYNQNGLELENFIKSKTAKATFIGDNCLLIIILRQKFFTIRDNRICFQTKARQTHGYITTHLVKYYDQMDKFDSFVLVKQINDKWYFFQLSYEKHSYNKGCIFKIESWFQIMFDFKEKFETKNGTNPLNLKGFPYYIVTKGQTEDKSKIYEKLKEIWNNDLN
eukprot:Pgem_evm1s5843